MVATLRRLMTLAALILPGLAAWTATVPAYGSFPPSDWTPAGMLHSPPSPAATGKPQRLTFAQN